MPLGTKKPGKQLVRGQSRSKIRGLLRHLAMVEGDADNAAYAKYLKGVTPAPFIFWEDSATMDALSIIKNRCLFALNARAIPAQIIR